MKSLFLIITGFVILPQLYGQPIQNNLINVSTKSPDAASLGKFGDIPVNTNTGATSVTIPLFNIKVGRISIPLSLDYHTGGIHVDETASSVGLGWALDGIGVLSRNVVGLPDEQSPGGYFWAPPLDSLYNDWSHAGGLYGSDFDLTCDQFLYNFQNGISETQPDIFSYSLANGGGKFVFRKDLSIFQIPKTNNIISQDGASYSITDENGIKYVFDVVEHVQIPSPSQYYVGNWRLSKMIDPFTVDTVYFSYESACDANIEHYFSYVYNFGTGPDCNENGSLSATAINYQGEKSSISTIIHPDELFPTQITWRGGKIVFTNACGRTDKASEKRLDEVDVYASVNGTYRQTKSVKLYQSYFYSNVSLGYTATDERNYRLRLDSVAELPIGTTDERAVYRMTYRTDLPMAARESTGVDQWGFNNGQFGNTTFMPHQTVLYNTSYYNIGEANRNVDTMYMKACMISSIQYPTGGKSVFEFEPHQYPTTQNYVVPHSVGAGAYGAVQDSSQFVFTPDSAGSAFMITYSFSAYSDTAVHDRPRITIVDQTTGSTLMLSSNIDPHQIANNYSAPTPWSPVMSHTYLITVYIFTTTASEVSATINIGWTDVYTNIPVNLYGGGLRIRAVTNYDNTGAFISRDLYKYGIGEDGLGQLLTPSSYLLVNYQAQNYRCATGVDAGCTYHDGTAGISYLAQPVYPATQFSGTPVLYSSVAKYQVDSLGNAANGKSEYQYVVFDDQSGYASTDYGKVGVLLITDAWRNGYLAYQNDYKYLVDGGYQLIHQKVNNYTASRQESLPGIIMKNLFNWNTSQCHLSSMPQDNNLYQLVQIPINSGAMLLTSTVDTTYDANNNALSLTTNYTYGDTTHLLPTVSQFADSKGRLTIDSLKYPHDLSSAGNVYSTMVQRNMIAPVIQDQTVYNGTQTHLVNTNYSDVSGIGTVLQPIAVNEQIAANPIETRIQFNLYDKYGNILQQQKTNDLYNSYIWDYNSMYPVAQCTNAAYTDIAFTSFEADGRGNWSGATVTDAVGFTGGNSYNLFHGNITKTGLNSATSYIVSYWTNTGSAFAVSGSTGVTQGKTIRGWTYFEHTVTGVSSVSVSGLGDIDELRLYPSTAQMTTYTYAPLVGITSQCDMAGRVTYYFYDALNRLSYVQDQDGNVVKRYCYNYNGQTTNCQVTIPIAVFAANASSQAVTITYTNTSTGTPTTFVAGAGTGTTQLGTLLTGNYTLTMGPSSPGGTAPLTYTVGSSSQSYYSTVSFGTVGISGNASITINPAPLEAVTLSNGTGESQHYQFTDVASGAVYSYDEVSGTSNAAVGTIPASTYNVTITPAHPYKGNPLTYTINSSTQTKYTAATFSSFAVNGSVSLNVVSVNTSSVNIWNSTNQSIQLSLYDIVDDTTYLFTMAPGSSGAQPGYVPAVSYTITMTPASPSNSYPIIFNCNGSVNYNDSTVSYSPVTVSGPVFAHADPPASVSITASNNSDKAVTVQFYNTATGYSVPAMTVPAGASGLSLGPIPAGNYNVTMTPASPSVSQPLYYAFNTFTQSYYGAVEFGNVSPSGSCTISIVKEY